MVRGHQRGGSLDKGWLSRVTGALPVQKPQGRSKQCKFQEEGKYIERTSYTHLLGAAVNKGVCINLSEALGGYLVSVTGITARRVPEALGEQ